MADYCDDNYCYTVDELLAEAGRRRSPHHHEAPGYSWDHIVELQLVVAALNSLREGTYSHRGWQRKLVDFFNCELNHQEMLITENETKGEAVNALIDGDELDKNDIYYIRPIRKHWRRIAPELRGFVQFKDALTDILESYY